MNKGKILKVRIGHEANCSSGMVFLAILIVASATYLPLVIITSIVQAIRLKKDKPRTKWRFLYWLIPQLLGLGCTAFLVNIASDDTYGDPSWLVGFALIIGISYMFVVTLGHIITPRIRHSWLNPLIVLASFLLINTSYVFLFA